MLRTILLAWMALAACAAESEAAATSPALADTAWHLRDHGEGSQGTGAARAWREFALKRPAQPVVVAVIDTGVDIAHPDLRELIWENPREHAGAPGVDDDGNGYVDDVRGWNFLGSRDGSRQILAASLEVSREYRRLHRRVVAGAATPADEQRLAQLAREHQAKQQETVAELLQVSQAVRMLDAALDRLERAGLRDPSAEGLRAFDAPADLAQSRQQASMVLQMFGSRAGAHQALARHLDQMRVRLDADWDFSAVIGDHGDDLDERGYGNGNPATGLLAHHGTHCAGIVAAICGVRGPGWVRILPLAAVPEGDERDKDIANAIRYAVDSGARILSMSFGKTHSPAKAAVDAAVRHAESRGALIVHAAGNEAVDIGKEPRYPTRRPLVGPAFAAWIEVAASGPRADASFAAEFTNYSAELVDIFAPGVGIRSTVPGGGHAEHDGSSMAAPQVAGVAALVWSQRPELTARELRDLLLRSARRLPDLSVRRPGSDARRPVMAPLSALCATGGVIDACAALEAAGVPRATLAPAQADPAAR